MSLEKDDSLTKDNSVQVEDAVAVHDLKELGYEPELIRSRGLPHILFMTLTILAVPCGLAAPIATSLIGGGPATMFWGLLFVSLLTLAIALSLAEIASAYPTAGGPYYWTFRLAGGGRSVSHGERSKLQNEHEERPASREEHTERPTAHSGSLRRHQLAAFLRRHRLLLSYVTGWLVITGDWMLALSAAFGTAQFFVAGVGIYHPEWEATAWQTYLIFLGILLLIGVLCIFCNRLLPILEIISACWIVLGLVAILACLPARARAGRHSAEFAFTHFDESFSGWPPGWTFFIGLFPPGYTFSGVGMIASMAEEVHRPALNVPRAMVWSVPIGCLMGIAFVLPINFTLPDVAELLDVTSVQPIAAMFTMVMGSKGGGFGLWFIVFIIALFCSISINCAASRATWSFARDKGLPFHRILARVDTRFTFTRLASDASSGSDSSSQSSAPAALPVNALLLSLAIQALLGLVYLGSSAAFNAFVGVEAMCLGASYAVPILVLMLNGRKGLGGRRGVDGAHGNKSGYGRRDAQDNSFVRGSGGADGANGAHEKGDACHGCADTEGPPYALGRWGWVANIVAVLWVGLEMVLFSMPAVLPVEKETMNYASVVFVGFAVISAAWYMISGRYQYTGPPAVEHDE